MSIINDIKEKLFSNTDVDEKMEEATDVKTENEDGISEAIVDKIRLGLELNK